MGKKEAVVIKPKVATPKPDAETMQKRAIRQGERADLTSSQRALGSAAYAQRTAQQTAEANQQAAQNYKPTTLPANTGIEYNVSQGQKVSRQENIQGYTDQYNYDVEQARQEVIGTISGEVKVAKAEYIENPVKGSPIHARTSAGGIKKKDPFAKTPTATDVFAQKPTDSVFATQSASYIDPTRADPSMNLTGKVQDNIYVNPLSVEPAVPFGALSVDERGLPYYGDGLKGWARKTWADLADPAKYKADIYKLTPDEQRKINSDYAQNVANSTAALSKTKWIGTFEKWFGLSARDVATFTSSRGLEMSIAEATDQNVAGVTAARLTRLGVDTVQNFIWGGLDLLGMDDTAVRKFTAGRVGIDAVADKYNKDEENFVDKLQSTAVGNAAFYLIGGPLAAAYQGYQTGKDFLTIAKEGELQEVNPLDKTSTISEYMAGSKMAYSMLFDNIAKEQFAIGLAEGKDPGLLAQNYGNVGIELAGSILGSPSTYLGLGIAKPVNIFQKGATEAGDVIPFVDEVIKLANGTFGSNIPIQRLPWKTVSKIPTFGEIMGLGIGKTRMASEAARFSGTSSNFAPVVEMLQDAQKLEGTKAAALLEEAVKATAMVFDNQRIRRGSRWWNLAAFDSNGKISVASRDADLFIGALTGSEGVQGTLEIMRDMVSARKGGDQAVEAVARLMNRSDTGVFSEVGDMVGEVMSRLDEADMLGIVKKYSGSTDPTALHAALTGELEKVLEEFIPSVDDMLKAEKLFVNGDKSARTVQLAEMAKDIPEPVRLINKVTQVPKKISQMTTGAMVQSYMAWMPRATAKNIEGQILPMAFHIGLGDALSATLDSIISLGNQSVLNKVADVVGGVNEAAGNVIRRTSAESILQRKAATLEKLFGFVPSTKGAGIQKVTKEFKGVFKDGLKLFENQLAKSGRAEVMADMMIKESVGKREILAALPAVIKNLPEYDAFVKALPDKAQASLFTNLLDKNYGVWDDAVDEFRKMTSTGVIEAWRVTPISSQMRKHLEYTGMIDAFTDLQRNASDPQQIDDFLKQFETLYRKNVTDEALKLPSTMQMPPPGQEKLFTSIELHPNEANNMIRELYLSAQNMRNQLNEVVSQANQSFIDQLGKIPDEAARLEASQKYQATVQKIAQVQKEVGAPQARLNNILENVNEWYKEVKSGPSQMRLSELWNKNVIYGTEEGFQLSKIYPDVDVNTLTPEVFADLMWKAQRNEAADKWMHYNTKLFDGVMGSLSDMSKEFGTSLDDIVMADKSGANPYRVLNDYYKKYAEIEEQYSWKRYLDQFTAAPDTKLSAIGGDKGKMLQEDYITRIVNTTEAAKTSKSKANPLVYLKDNGGIAPTDFKDIFGESTAQGVLPGLLKKDARAIDDVGIRLWEGGFISREQADDYEYIRDFLRGFQKGTVLTDAQIAAKEANYFLDQAGMSVVPYEEITIQQARDALRNTKRVYSYDGGPLNEARVMYEGMDNFLNDTQLWGQKIKDEWGKTVQSGLLSSEAEAQMQKAKTAFEQRMKVVRRSAAVTAQSTRNFVLHSYDKTYLDHALSYLLGNSLHYWSTRSYARTIETLVDQPKIANTYLAYREYMTKKHSDMPEWYRYNIDVGSLMGIDSNNQYFINLEQAVNPIMGLTGVDFDDPYKRVDWMSRMVADSGKLGVSFSPLVNWAIALKANEQGNAEAAQRWAGRLIPQSQYIKSVSSGLDNILEKFGVTGIDTKPLEIDPFVLMFTEGKTLSERMMNGVDPYERNKVVASLATMVQAGEITEEQMIEAAKAKSGDIWQSAIEKAADKRYTGDIQSFFLGSGMKPRTQEDMVIEKFWGDYSILQASRSQMTPEEYRVAFTNMHDNPEYGKFVDGLLLSRKSGTAMDSAYTYNVLGRIPPGQMTDIAKVVGLNPDQIALFYEMKGDFTKMGLSTSDLANFNAGIADIAAMVAMPSTATKQQWNQVSTLYSAMRDAMTQEFGSDIYDRIGAYYELQSTADKNKFLENNPDVEAAMAKETGYKANTPLLMQYYGGMSTLERYYSNQVTQTLKDKYAPAIIDDASKLYDKNTSPEQRDAILRQYSPLRQYQYEYGNADTQAAQQLQSKWGDMSEALALYDSEAAIRDYSYRKEIDKQYHVSQYKRELNSLTKTLRKEINAEYGTDIVNDAKVYGQISDADRKNELESKYSDLEKYLNEKSTLYDENFQAIVDFGNYLPEGVTPEPRLESTPANGDQQQQDLYDLMNNPVPEKTFEDWTEEIGTPTAELIQDAFTSDSIMPYEVTKRLGYEAERLGYRNADALLQAILLSLQN